MRTRFSMNTPRHSRPALDVSTGEKRRLLLICGLSVVFTFFSAARAAHSPAPVGELHFVPSVFVAKPGFGKDPFFPKSTRLGPVQVTTNTVEVSPTPISSLILKGISGPKNHRLAIINNKTFEIGEEAEIKAVGETLRVKCIDVRDDGVVVSVNGQTQKLYLGVKP